MRIRFVIGFMVAAITVAPSRGETPLGTAFTYQGQLKKAGAPFDGTADFQFTLWDAAGSGNPPTGGVQVGGVQAINAQAVVSGLFTVALNAGGAFGANAFDGNARWLQIAMRSPAGSGAFTTIAPRQPLTAAPFALQSRGIFADDAGNVGIGTKTPHHRLRISGGPAWTSNLWSGALELDNAAALAWQPNAAGSRFGIGQTAGGLSFFHSFSDPGTTGESAIYDMTIADSGRIGIGTSTPGFPLTVQKVGYGWVHTDGVRELGSFVNSSGAFLGTRSNDPLQLFTANSTSQVTLTTAGNLGIGTTSPGQRLDVNGRMRARQGADGSAGMWLYQSGPSADRALVGMRDDNAVGFYGSGGSGWGLIMDVATGIVGIGTNTPSTTTRLDVVTAGAGYWAVHGDSPNGSGVVGTSAAGGNAAAAGINSAVDGIGVYGEANLGLGAGVWGISNQGYGVRGDSTTGFAIFGNATNTVSAYAGWFNGDVQVAGVLRKNSGSFRIDHPLDPPNKYLSHSFVESPDMMNVYNGNVTTDADGYATITMPDWFETLNKDFRYQLTVIDTNDSADFVQAKVVREVANNQFTIRTSRPSSRVSWQVTGIRQDAWANAHRIAVEEDKPDREKGKYLTPELFGSPREMGIGYLPSKDAMK